MGKKNAEKYHFDPNNIGLFRASAGAHLSLMAAYTPDNTYLGNPELSSYSAKVNYVIDHYGPADLNKLFHTKLGTIPVALIGLMSKKLSVYRKILSEEFPGLISEKIRTVLLTILKRFPAYFVSGGVPTLIVQGIMIKLSL